MKQILINLQLSLLVITPIIGLIGMLLVDGVGDVAFLILAALPLLAGAVLVALRHKRTQD